MTIDVEGRLRRALRDVGSRAEISERPVPVSSDEDDGVAPLGVAPLPFGRSPRRIVWAAAAAVLAVVSGVGAVTVLDDGDEGVDDVPVVAGPSAAEPAVSITTSGLGSLRVTTSNLRPAATAWLEHTISIENTGPSTIYINDHRTGQPLGDREVLAADEGCGYGGSPGDSVGPVCQLDYRAITVEPGDKTVSVITLWRDLPGMNQVTSDTYVFAKPIVFGTIPFSHPDQAGSAGEIVITYEDLDRAERTTDPTVPVEAVECAEPPFQPTFLPPNFAADLRAGSGGHITIDEDGSIKPTRVEDQPEYMSHPAYPYRHYRGPAGIYIDVIRGAAISGVGPSDGVSGFEPEDITVLGRAGQVGGIHEGYGVRFDLGTEPCDQYLLAAFGVTMDDLIAFAEGLESTVPTPRDNELIARFLRFAADPSPATLAALPFADEVALGLGSELHLTRRASELADPGAWTIEVGSGGFRAYSGPFSTLELAAEAGETVVSVGEHPHCAGPPPPAPAEFADLRRVSVQPAPDTIDTCLKWWTVDLFVTDAGEIAAVTLDLYEP